jgi:predicted dienelactone hydrolase
MQRLFAALAAIACFLSATCLTATPAAASGFRFIEVPGDANGPPLKGAMWYPCANQPRESDPVDGAVPRVNKCPISGDKLPLVVISHGNGGGFIDHRDTAVALADAGFVVVAIDHPGDSYGERGRWSTALAERPTDIKRLIDFMLGAAPASSRIDRQRVGFFGFSAGGFTGLELIGANSDWAAAIKFCRGLRSAFPRCERLIREEFPVRPVTPDPRIKAAVLADPGTVFFSAASLAAVTVPVQLWASARGNEFVRPESIAALNRDLPEKHEYHLVQNSWHDDFWLCPAAQQGDPDCADAPGFDRAAFHKRFNAAVLAFFRTNFGKT